ncbi:MAG TPA: SufS family cysteine desulfurase [Tepidisphaeraceae bacterium]|jgi:cysteine desulfurase/selenocysteine lyase
MTATLTPPITFDPLVVRRDFPILQTHARGKPLVYLDNGATTQKPQIVIDAVRNYYEKQNANIHRGVYELSQVATEGYEAARRTVARFINAPDPAEVIFTRGTTEGINLVAHAFARAFLTEGDEVVITALEHHSNIVPWQMACQASGAKLRVIPINDAGEVVLEEFATILSSRVKMVAVSHASNSLGTLPPVEQIIAMARSVGASVLIDGAQWVAHAPTDVQALDCDFYAFSGHKVFGPTGIGVLWGRRELLEKMPPYQGGGDMVERVTFAKTTYAALPNKFEAGTPNIAGAIGLGAALEYLESVGLENVRAYKKELLAYLTERISSVEGVRLVGTAAEKASVVSFVIDNPPLSAHDVGVMLDLEGIAVRTGHHCCQPVMDRFGIPATARASIAMYNTRDDVDRFVTALARIIAAARPKAAAAKVTAETVRFPEPSAPSLDEAAADLIDTFDMFEDWKDKYQVLIEMGEKLLPMPTEFKNDLSRVHGCQSTVHLVARKHPGGGDKLDFLADSDADLVRGLIGILQKLFSGQSSRAILGFDIEAFFKRLGLDQHLTMGRRNGLAGMVQRLHAHAGQFVTISG